MRVAVFDLDGTLIKYSTERRFLPWATLHMKFCPFRFVPYLFRSIKDRDFFSTKLYYRGISVEKIKEMADHFFSSHRVKRMVFPGAKEEINRRKQEGFELILLTGAPEFFAEKFSFLGFDRIIGAKLEVRNGVFTGLLLDYPSGRRKAEILEELSKKEDIDLERSYGYGNSFADRYFLNLLGNPRAVNPGFRFRRYAIKKGWKILKWS